MLSNITRFPFSNIVHEIRQKNRQELGDFSKENLLTEILQLEDGDGRSLEARVTSLFPRVDVNRMRDVLLGRTANFDDEDYLIWSLLNSSLDARVIDFVRRDSLHIGLVKGDAFDIDTLLPHLTIYNHRLALRSTGVSVAEEIIALRYWLFNRVYWNRPNRGYCAMVRHLLLGLGTVDGFQARLRACVLTVSERELLQFLNTESCACGNQGLIRIAQSLCDLNQDVYRTAFDVSYKEQPDMKTVCSKVGLMDYSRLTDLAKELDANVPSLEPTKVPNGSRVIIDMPYEPGGAETRGGHHCDPT